MPSYQKIRPKSVSQQVFDQLRDHIFRGELKPGDRLPPERELAQGMGVSRPTLREAINRLADRGLLEHRQGQGTFVAASERRRKQNPLSVLMDGQEATLPELLEVRLALESNAAMLAARRATSEDIANLEKCYLEMKNRVKTNQHDIGDDVFFHMAIAYAGKNQVQTYLMKSLHDLVRHGIRKSLAGLWTRPGQVENILRQHCDVMRAIRDHDADGAFEAMRLHITFVIEAVMESKVAGRPLGQA